MGFLKGLFRNLTILIGIGLVGYFIYPDMINLMYDSFGLLFGPLAILMVIAFTISRRRLKKRCTFVDIALLG